MKCRTILLFGALTVGIAAVAIAQSSTVTPSQDPSTQGQNQNPSAQDSTSQSSASSSDTANDALSVFSGSIMKSGSKYVLHSTTGDYDLDDQSQAESFAGKEVEVAGTLDKATNTIRVKSIEPPSSED